MTTISPEFNNAANDVFKLTKKPSQEVMLKLYGLYKRVTVGSPPVGEPSVFNLKENAKWKAWDYTRRYSRKTAETMYIDLVNSLKESK